MKFIYKNKKNVFVLLFLTTGGDRLEILTALAENYEARHFPVELPDPVEAIKFRMEQGNLSVADMQPYIGNANRVYEVLTRAQP